MSVQFSGLPVRPFKAPDVNAGSSVIVEYAAYNLANVLEAPSAMRYRIDNLTDSRIILPWTPIETPEEEGSVTIPASLNQMTWQYRDRQFNQVTFEATFDNGDVVQQMCSYTLCAVFTGATG